MPQDHIHFITGRLAEASLRGILAELGPKAGFAYTVQVLNITVAALMTAEWIAKRIEVPTGTTKVLITGYCRGDLSLIEAVAGVPVERGPKDLRQLPDWFQCGSPDESYGQHDIQIIAEINHAPSFTPEEMLAEARLLATAGAELIDVGCDPGGTWLDVAERVGMLREHGFRVSIDSLNPVEIAAATGAGAELVLSVNSQNRKYAPDWGCEVVAIPDDPKSLDQLDETIAYLEKHNVPYRIDPILEPIAFGFAESLVRYSEIRRRYPEAEMMMGIGNLTELTDVDSAGVNVLLLGFCQELGIRSVLTTQVISWAQTSVKECDLARRLVHYAVTKQTLPKRLEPRLVTLRDARPVMPSLEEIEALAGSIKDSNYRMFSTLGTLHLISANLHLEDADPFLLFDKLMATEPTNMSPSHAFYLGYELAKAKIAATLGKEYRQDEALDWGYLTEPEPTHRLKLDGRNTGRTSDQETGDA
ncbi:MAG: DUF6513 domain-containing protein [Pirellulaceae bacterium]